jgi:large subunit ribosomal protein L24
MKVSMRSSSKPGKVKKNRIIAPIHKRNNSMPRASLSDALNDKYGRRTVRVRIGDSVKLVRGEYSGIEGKVQKVFASEGLVTVEGITREKIAGGTTPVRIHTTNVVVTNLNLDDKWRRDALQIQS